MHKLKDIIRNFIPLPIRQKIGPVLGYVTYWYRTRFIGKSWEPTVLSSEETIGLILSNKSSLIRFGDGEISLIEGRNLGFQTYDKNLSEELKKIIEIKDDKLLIAIPNFFGRIEHFSPTAFWFTIHNLFRNGYLWKKYTNKKIIYGDAFVTRPYLLLKDKRESFKIFSKIKQLWQNRDIIIVEGKGTRIGVGNDLLSNAKSISRIICPSENAYSEKDRIINVTKKINNNKLILLSLGPAAKPIAYELFKAGYQVIDIGHIDMEYEMFLRKSKKLIPVAGKYFNEINERNPEDKTDPVYQSQIIATVV